MKTKKKNPKLLVSLFKYYITFVLVLTAIFVGTYLYLGTKISKYIDQADSMPIINIINGQFTDYKEINGMDLKSIGAYFEVLNRDKQVIYRDGEVPEGLADSYSEEEFEDLISGTVDKKYDFNVICKSIQVENEDRNLVLIMIPKDRLFFTFKLAGAPYEVVKPLYKLYIIVIGVGIFLSIISIIVYSIWTSKRIKKPLAEIDKALGKVIDGDYDEKFVLTGQKEFVVISDTVNFLIDKLKTSREENAKLQESKTKMLMDLSHDIKTPITTIRGFSAALSEGLIEGEDKKQRYYKTIYNKSEHVGELVDELFEFVKLQNTQNILKIEEIDICEFIRQIIVNYVDEIEEKNFKLEINIPEEVIKLKIDCRLFKRAIGNLIQNAIKYNPEGTKIRIEVTEVENYVAIEVADTGIGIPDSIKNNIFDAFVRGDTSRSSDGGSGLGLAITSKIIANHGGTIEVFKGKGEEKTVFYIKMYKQI